MAPDDLRTIVPEIPAKTAPQSLLMNRLGLNQRESYLSVIIGILGCFSLVFLVVAIVGYTRAVVPATGSPVCQDAGCFEASALMAANANFSVDPCDNFYKFACGGWQARNPLNADESSRSVRSDLYYRNEERIRSALETDVVRDTPNSWERKSKAIYQSCVDTFQRNLQKGKPLLDLIKQELGDWNVVNPSAPQSTAAWSFMTTLEKMVVDYQVGAIFRLSVSYNSTTKTQSINMYRSGTQYYGYYVGNSTYYVKVMTSYRTYMKRLGDLLMRDSGITINDAAQTRFKQFLDDAFYTENVLAHQQNSVKSSSYRSTPFTFANISATMDQFTLRSLFKRAFPQYTVQDNTLITMSVRDWEYFRMANSHVKTEMTNGHNRRLSNYLIWRLLYNYHTTLSTEYDHANKEYQQMTSGRTDFAPEWLTCFYTLRMRMNPALDAIFATTHLGENGKAQAIQMVDQIHTQINEMAKSISWMDDKTRLAAVKKVMSVKKFVGYPDFVDDNDKLDKYYMTLSVNSSNSYFHAVLNLYKFYRDQMANNLVNGFDTAGTDFNQWKMNAYSTVLVYYNFYNELTLPAGYMQPPLYSSNMPKYYDFGILGRDVAEEFFLSINDFGKYYNGNGSFLQWWSPTTEKGFQETRSCVADYFNTLKLGPLPLPDGPSEEIDMNGNSFASRGIEDLASLRIAYAAYKSWQQANGVEQSGIQSSVLTSPDHLFFLAYAQGQCTIRTPSNQYWYAKMGIMPVEFQVNGALSHTPEFQQAFKCPAGKAMNPTPKCNAL